MQGGGPRRICLLAAQFDELQISAFSAAVGQLTSDDIPDVRDAIMLQLGAGGRGFRPMAEDCYGLYDGAWAQSAHRLARRLRADDPRRDISVPAATAYAQAHDGSVHAENTDAHLRALGLDHRAELRRAHALLGNLQAASELPSAVATDVGSVLDQLLVTGVRIT